MILLDTNAIIWVLAAHPRVTPLLEEGAQLYISPVSLLELKYLVEVGRLEVVAGRTLKSVAEDPRWHLDSPTSDALFEAALDLDWTRDPFDRLLTAHALLRSWRIASGDRNLKEKLAPAQVFAL